MSGSHHVGKEAEAKTKLTKLLSLRSNYAG
jgi:hypothetical protein